MFHDVTQKTKKWFDLRVGLATSSNFSKIMAKGERKGFKRYARKVALEIVTGQRDEMDDFKSAYMEQGNDLEDYAVTLYEKATLSFVTNGGFYESGRYGDSPDGNIKDDPSGCVEVKVVGAENQWNRLAKGGYDTTYKYQIQGHMLVGEKSWCDFVQHCPVFPEWGNLYIFRVERNDTMIQQLKLGLEIFDAEVDANVKFLNDLKNRKI